MRVFVTGVDGYIGAVLAPYLQARGMSLAGLDTGYYRDGCLYAVNGSAPGVATLAKDLRAVTAADLAGCDALVHLAELSNDPLAQNHPRVTHLINHQGSVTLAQQAVRAGIRRFIYTSSCSVYGAGSGELLDEDAPVNPQTAYAECKLLVERDLRAMAGVNFTPVLLRNAMTSDGSPWRPVVHVEDICEAIYRSLLAPADVVSGRVFNVGQTSENYRVRELARIVADEFPGCSVSTGPPSGDTRSYRVSFERIHRELPGFHCRYTARAGVRQLHQLFERIQMTPETYRFRAFTRLRQLEHLQASGQINDELYWR